jgi:hypothetical protein
MDERDHVPSVGLLRRDGSVERHFLSVEEDKWIDADCTQSTHSEESMVAEFLEELKEMGSDRLDFLEGIRQFLRDNKVGKRTKRILLEVTELEE